MQNNVVVFFSDYSYLIRWVINYHYQLSLSCLWNIKWLTGKAYHSFICTGEVISHHSFLLKLQSLHLLLEEDCRKPSCVTSEEVETVGLCMRWSCAFCVLYLLNVSALHQRFTFFLKTFIFHFQYEKYPTKCMKIDDVYRASIFRFLQHFPLLWTIICKNKLNVNVENIPRREKQLYVSSNHILGLFLEGKKQSSKILLLEIFLELSGHLTSHNIFTSRKRVKAKSFHLTPLKKE